MMNDNDLIRRGDVLDALEYRVGTVSQWNLVTKAINAIPAVSGEPEGTVSKNCQPPTDNRHVAEGCEPFNFG